ncbi:MAG: DUF2784 domain-containing protein [Thermodesulfobacteriota bacterium]
MLRSIAADAVTIVHLAFIVFVVAGGLLAFRWPRLALVHLPAAGWGAFIEFTGRICPLTPLEERLRQGNGPGEEGFIAHYLLPIIYPAGLTPAVQIGLGVAVIVVNAGVYGWLIAGRLRKAGTGGGLDG